MLALDDNVKLLPELFIVGPNQLAITVVVRDTCCNIPCGTLARRLKAENSQVMELDEANALLKN